MGLHCAWNEGSPYTRKRFRMKMANDTIRIAKIHESARTTVSANAHYNGGKTGQQFSQHLSERAQRLPYPSQGGVVIVKFSSGENQADHGEGARPVYVGKHRGLPVQKQLFQLSHTCTRKQQVRRRGTHERQAN